MTKIVSPEEFRNAFLAVAASRTSAVEAAFYSGPALTQLALNEKNGLLATVATELGLQYCREYYGIDFVMCERADEEHFRPAKGWWIAQQLTIAVEHENRIWGAGQEMNKLAMLNAPLKVLITYPWKEDVGDYLGTYATIVKNADVFGDFTSRRKHLTLLASWRGEHVLWECFVYRSGKFVPMGANS